jgi:RNA-directed DNA polymerase
MFLGYTFRLRLAKSSHGSFFVGFLLAVRKGAAREMERQVKGWRLHLRTDLPLEDLADWINPIGRGWINY